MRITLKDIAQECGLSVTLVSQVLRNPENPKFRPDTRRKVLEAAQRANYVPNQSAASLQRGYSKMIALVTPWNMIDVPDAVERSAALSGYQTVVLSSSEPSVEYQFRALKLALSLQVDGIIWLPFGTAAVIAEAADLLRSQRLPVLVLERFPERLAESWAFLSEDYGQIGELTMRALPRPERELLLISSAPPKTENNALFDHLTAAADVAGKPVRVFYPQRAFCYDADGEQYGRQEQEWTALDEALNTECDIFCDGDWLAWDLWKMFGAARFQLPQRAILTYGDFRLGARGRLPELLAPGISALRRPFYALGRQAVALLLDMIQGKPEAFGIHYNQEIELIHRNTTKS